MVASSFEECQHISGIDSVNNKRLGPDMKGLMMNRPLRIVDILTFGEETHSEAEIVSVTVEGGIHRTTYGKTAPRVRKMANALKSLNVKLGDRVATLAWNGYRHFELYYAISGIGAICHTINPRLSAEQMVYIINHAGDSVICVDLTFVPILEALKSQLNSDITYIIMTDRDHMPKTTLQNVVCYEEILELGETDIEWPEFPEETASSLCYTSGTTGNPKGSLYTHRSTVLHSLTAGISFPETMRAGVKILPVVPLFHVNAWGLAYVAPLVGASIIFPGPNLDGKSIFDLMDSEQVFSAWGVPTVWLGLLSEIKNRGQIPNGFGEVIIGGSAVPKYMVESFEKMNVSVCHAWGMTEMSPIGTNGRLSPVHSQLPLNERIDLKVKQGRRVYGVELKIIDETGNRLPHDGVSNGELYVRGNMIISDYYNNPEATRDAMDADGWFGTGDVATIDSNGFLTITDRAKDLIKSGGEWISSIDVENMAMGHDDVSNCAVIAIPDPKWDERPLLIVVPNSDVKPDATSILNHLGKNLAKWQIPDKVIFVESLPLTATGKVSKLTLRKEYSGES